MSHHNRPHVNDEDMSWRHHLRLDRPSTFEVATIEVGDDENPSQSTTSAIPFPNQAAERDTLWWQRAMRGPSGMKSRLGPFPWPRPHEMHQGDALNRLNFLDRMKREHEHGARRPEPIDILRIRTEVEADPALLDNVMFLAFAFLRLLTWCAPVFAGPCANSVEYTKKAAEAYEALARGKSRYGLSGPISRVFREWGFDHVRQTTFDDAHAKQLRLLANEIFPEEQYGQNYAWNPEEDGWQPPPPRRSNPFHRLAFQYGEYRPDALLWENFGDMFVG